MRNEVAPPIPAAPTLGTLTLGLILTLLSPGPAAAADFPEAGISNGMIEAKLYLPDAERGYYRGTRFDWSGQIYSLRVGGNEYFGQWFEKYDPKLHDAIMGPVEDFRTGDSSTGFDEAAPGGIFYRIGVGALRRPDDQPFQPFRTYEITDPGTWKVQVRPSSVTFTQQVSGPHGYGWQYTKTIRLVKGKPQMVIEHALKNTGTKHLRTQQYNHNFFVMNGQPTGPDTRVEFPFELAPLKPFATDVARVEGRRIVYTRELEKGESAYAQFAGAPVYEVILEHRKAGTGVKITGDRPIERIVYWSIRSTFCPEPYIDVSAAPGKTSRWTYTYSFYSVP
jgi:hypothetical protein